MSLCDTCGKDRRDVQSMGRDSNGDPDAPDMCFLCRKEMERRRVWDRKLGRYVSIWAHEAMQDEARALKHGGKVYK